MKTRSLGIGFRTLSVVLVLAVLLVFLVWPSYGCMAKNDFDPSPYTSYLCYDYYSSVLKDASEILTPSSAYEFLSENISSYHSPHSQKRITEMARLDHLRGQR